MARRINVVLPETTIQAIDRMAKRGGRSQFINQAVRHYLADWSIASLRTRLELTTERDRDLDREIAADWFAVDQQGRRQLEETNR